ncbi:MAG: type I methionyl aminopeptidase [Firmicutes bacterium]|nr:type I methionyl aminopeptidase [Bacillota bacterium]HAL63343.1 type I methionyl aminopeptidase [Clostridiales bacterium]
MVTIKSKAEIEKMRAAGKITGDALREVEKYIKPGISTFELDKIAFDFIKKHGATPSFLHYNGFPGSICASPNSWVVHGIPSKNIVLKEGDIISIDMGAQKDGYHGDAARTYAVGNISDEAKRLIDVTKRSFFEGIKHATHGAKLGDVSYAIQEYVESNGFSVVRDLVGHGIGKNLHEDPNVPNYGHKGKGLKLAQGMTIAVEPMVNAGRYDVVMLDDDWTVETEDGSLSAHYENTILITKGECEILTL